MEDGDGDCDGDDDDGEDEVEYKAMLKQIDAPVGDDRARYHPSPSGSSTAVDFHCRHDDHYGHRCHHRHHHARVYCHN